MARRRIVTDTNHLIAGLLRDLAAVQRTKQSKWGYERAAEAVAGLPTPIESHLQPDGTLRKIAQVGPSSTRVILEVLQTGGSTIVQQAIAESGKGADVEKSRGLRDTLPQPRRGAGGAPQPAAARAVARRLSRRSADALHLQRRQSDPRGHLRDRDGAGIRILVGDRSFVRVADRPRRVDGPAGRAASRDRSAQRQSTRDASG